MPIILRRRAQPRNLTNDSYDAVFGAGGFGGFVHLLAAECHQEGFSN
jgi:hypothetical protein